MKEKYECKNNMKERHNTNVRKNMDTLLVQRKSMDAIGV
jgi:hypothetical protein